MDKFPDESFRIERGEEYSVCADPMTKIYQMDRISDQKLQDILYSVKEINREIEEEIKEMDREIKRNEEEINRQQIRSLYLNMKNDIYERRRRLRGDDRTSYNGKQN
mgnify:CR=1 FL=1